MTFIDTEPDRYRDGNSALFRRRAELREELTAAESDERTTTRRLRMLRRSLDDATAQILTYNMGLVRSYTRRFTGAASSNDRAEFESAGVLGLMRAIETYDVEAGPFGQWAFKPIQREVLRSVRENDHPNLSMGDFEKRPVIMRAQRQMQGVDESYQPSHEEIAEAAGVTVNQVSRVLGAPRLTSIHEPVGDDESVDLLETIASDEPGAEDQLISKQTIDALEEFGLRALDERERYIVVRRFGLDHEPPATLADISETLELSREAVRQIEGKALSKLQHPIVLRKLDCCTTRRPTMTRA
jgi:RNA polymerase sigma factor (sigma-70 family)